MPLAIQCCDQFTSSGQTRGEITRHDDHGANFIHREDDSLTTTFTQGTWKVAINPFANIDTMCAARPHPRNTSLTTKAMQCSPYMCDSGVVLELNPAMMWSNVATWQELSISPLVTGGAHSDGTKPGPWAIVEIPSGYHVVLDELPPILTKIQVYGKLSFSDEMDIELHTEALVNFGVVEIGTDENPRMHKAEIVLHGNRTSATVVVSDQHFLGNKMIANFGNFSMVSGSSVTVTKVEINSTANVGDTTVSFTSPVDWDINDTIVLAGTDPAAQLYPGHTGTYSGSRFVVLPGPTETTGASEELVVTGVSPDGLTVTFTPPLVNRHYSGTMDLGVDTERFSFLIGNATNNAVLDIVPRGVGGLPRAGTGWNELIGANDTDIVIMPSSEACCVTGGDDIGCARGTAYAGKLVVVVYNINCDMKAHTKAAKLRGAEAIAIVTSADQSWQSVKGSQGWSNGNTALLLDYEVAIPALLLRQSDGDAILAAVQNGVGIRFHRQVTYVDLRASVGHLTRNIVVRGEVEQACTAAEHAANLAHYQQHCAENSLTFHECSTGYRDTGGSQLAHPYPHACYWIKGYGGHMVTTEWNYGSEDQFLAAVAAGNPLPRQSVGQIRARGVEFRDMGKLGSEHRAFQISYFHDYTPAEVPMNLIDRCVWRNSWYDALVVGHAPAMNITSTISHRTLGMGIATGDPMHIINFMSRAPAGFVRRRRGELEELHQRIRRSMSQAEGDHRWNPETLGQVLNRAGDPVDLGPGHLVDDNMVTDAFQYPSETLNQHSTYQWHSGMALRTKMASMKRNVVSGAAYAAYSFAAHDAKEKALGHIIRDNEGYASYYGAVARFSTNWGDGGGAKELFRFKAWSNTVGITAYDETRSFMIREVTIANNEQGMATHFIGENLRLWVRSSYIIGDGPASEACRAHVGLQIPMYIESARPGPRCTGLFGGCDRECQFANGGLHYRHGNTRTGRLEGFDVESVAFAYFGPPDPVFREEDLPDDAGTLAPNVALDSAAPTAAPTDVPTPTPRCAYDARGIGLADTEPDYSPDIHLRRIRWHSTVGSRHRINMGGYSDTHEGCANGAFCDAIGMMRLYDHDASTIGGLWGDFREEAYRATTLYSDLNPAITNEANCRAVSALGAIMCENFDLTVVALDVPPLTPDGGVEKSSVSHMVIHKYHPGGGVGNSNVGDPAYNRTYFSVGAFEQGKRTLTTTITPLPPPCRRTCSSLSRDVSCPILNVPLLNLPHPKLHPHHPPTPSTIPLHYIPTQRH